MADRYGGSASALSPFFNLTVEFVMEQLDLVDEMSWEDSDKVEFVSLEDAGLEEAPLATESSSCGHVFRHGILSYLDWFYDNESSEYSE